jgi:hypothetical protein
VDQFAETRQTARTSKQRNHQKWAGRQEGGAAERKGLTDPCQDSEAFTVGSKKREARELHARILEELFVKGLFSSEMNRMDNCLGNPKTTLSQAQIDILYGILRCFDAAAFKAGLPYTMACGTVLGAVLRGGLIPWDTDADLFARASDFYKVLPELQAQTAGILRIESYTKWSDGRGWYKIYSPIAEYPNVDLYLLQYNPSTNVWNPSDHQVAKRANLFLDGEQNGPSTRIPFGPLRLPVFPQATRFLDRFYGPGWRFKSTETDVLRGVGTSGVLADFRPALPSETIL